MKVLLKILVFSVFAINCQNTDNKDKNRLITFDLKELPKVTSVKLSDLGFVDIEYIPLETNELSLISSIDNVFFNEYNSNKIISGDDYFIIKNVNSILKFGKDGSFISKIGTVGRGPEEFTGANDIDINKKNQYIYIASGWQKKLNAYSGTGDFIRAIETPFSGLLEFISVDGGLLFYLNNFMGNIENSFILLDYEGNVIKKIPNRYPFSVGEKNRSGFSHENLFYRFNNRIYKKEIYSDTIYSIENMSFKPHMVINVGDKLITPKARSEFDAFYIGKNFITPMNLMEFGDYVYYSFIYKFAPPDDVLIYSFIGSRKNDFRALIDIGQGFINDLDGGMNVLPLTIKDDNTIIALADALKLKTHVASEAFKNSTPKYPEKKKELEKLANSLKETDNPVLMIARLKK